MASRRVTVAGVPDWVDAGRLLGPEFARAGDEWVAAIPLEDAARVDARLRGIGLGGHPIAVDVDPRLPRDAVRAARLLDARDRREKTPGFTRPRCRLDGEGQYSLTPEALALALGKRAAGRRVIDAMTGCGGNAIGFARAGCRVVAVDIHGPRLAMAAHNARIYAVADRISFRQGRAEDAVADADDLVFLDPPWGREWPKSRCALADFPVLAATLGRVPRGVEVWIKVPPSFDPASTPGFSAEAWFGEAAGDRHRVKFALLTRKAG